jgi:hypothetical protein
LALVPLLWKCSKPDCPAVPVKVPHSKTVVPGPIWLAPVPQLLELLNPDGVRFGAVLVPVGQFPVAVPPGVT